jgi:hypothetical protein
MNFSYVVGLVLDVGQDAQGGDQVKRTIIKGQKVPVITLKIPFRDTEMAQPSAGRFDHSRRNINTKNKVSLPV